MITFNQLLRLCAILVVAHVISSSAEESEGTCEDEGAVNASVLIRLEHAGIFLQRGAVSDALSDPSFCQSWNWASKIAGFIGSVAEFGGHIMGGKMKDGFDMLDSGLGLLGGNCTDPEGYVRTGLADLEKALSLQTKIITNFVQRQFDEQLLNEARGVTIAVRNFLKSEYEPIKSRLSKQQLKDRKEIDQLLAYENELSMKIQTLFNAEPFVPSAVSVLMIAVPLHMRILGEKIWMGHADAITWTNYHRDYSESFAQAKGKYVSTLAAADTCYKFGCVGSDATARCYGLVCGPHGKYSGGLTVVNNFEQYMHPAPPETFRFRVQQVCNDKLWGWWNTQDIDGLLAAGNLRTDDESCSNIILEEALWWVPYQKWLTKMGMGNGGGWHLLPEQYQP